MQSKPVSFADGKYHHLCVTYDNGHVNFYLDGAAVGESWLPGGAPVQLARDLLVGEDAEEEVTVRGAGHNCISRGGKRRA